MQFDEFFRSASTLSSGRRRSLLLAKRALKGQGKVPKLAILQHEEGVRLDPIPLVALYSDLGQKGAERQLSRAVEELAARMAEVMRHTDEGTAPSAIRAARLVGQIADRIGMASLARIAADVVATTEFCDHAAQAATLARLVRACERSLSAVWDLRDLTS